MQQVAAHVWTQRIPGATVTIATPFPHRDAPHYALATVVRSRRRNLSLATVHLGLLALARTLGFRLRRYRFSSEIDAMCRADVVVDLSGDMLTEDYGLLVGYSHMLPLMQALLLGKPLFVCAQSIGPFNRLEALAKAVLSRAAMVTVREHISEQLVRGLGLDSDKCRKTADLAFLLEPAKEDRTLELLEYEGIPPCPPKRVRLGVSVSALLSNRNNRHLKNGLGSLSTLASALDVLATECDIEFMLVPHVFGPRDKADDRHACLALTQEMTTPVHMINGEYRPEELKGIIATCDAFVGCRMHANIAALDSEVPTLAIGYSHKTAGIMGELGVPEWVVPVESLKVSTFLPMLRRLLDEREAYKDTLKDRLPGIRDRSIENLILLPVPPLSNIGTST